MNCWLFLTLNTEWKFCSWSSENYSSKRLLLLLLLLINERNWPEFIFEANDFLPIEMLNSICKLYLLRKCVGFQSVSSIAEITFECMIESYSKQTEIWNASNQTLPSNINECTFYHFHFDIYLYYPSLFLFHSLYTQFVCFSPTLK